MIKLTGLLLGLSLTSAFAGGPMLPTDSRQLIRVITSDWSVVTGQLQRFERDDSSGAWRPVGQAIRIVVGKNGMALDKQEGDGKAPAGVFSLGATFGYQTPTAAWSNPFILSTQSLVCVDDPKSKHYNQILDESVTTKDWDSAERMKRTDVLYRYGLVVNYNTSPAVAGKGSCIFVHIWRNSSTGTAGCTAMTEKNLTALLAWINPSKKPQLVQYPQAEYDRLKSSGKLP